MKIAVAGGLGFEKEIASGLQGHPLLMVGSGYDLKREKFPVPPGAEFIGEYLTHNYHENFSEYDLFVDVSENLKSKYLVNDFAVKYGRKALLFFFDEGWKLAVIIPGDGCFQCLRKYQKPQEPCGAGGISGEVVMEMIRKGMEYAGTESAVLDLQGKRVQTIGRDKGCPGSSGLFHFLNGEMADVISVSCSDHSVAITPMNEVIIDLKQFEKFVSKEANILKSSPYFVEFRIRRYSSILFRQGRLVVKNTKDKNLAYHLYRRFVGG